MISEIHRFFDLGRPGRPRGRPGRPGRPPWQPAAQPASRRAAAREAGRRRSAAPGRLRPAAQAADRRRTSEPRMPRFLPMDFIMSAIWRCIFTSLLMSCTDVPEPAATRFLREALSSFGFLRSDLRHRADDRLLALEDRLVEIGGVDLLLDLADAGQHAEHAAHAAELLHLASAARPGPRGRRRPCASLRAMASALSISTVSMRLLDEARPRRPCRGCARRCAMGRTPPARRASRPCRSA